MREIAVAAVLSAVILRGVFLLPYSTGGPIVPQPAAVQQETPTPSPMPRAVPQPPAPPVMRHVQNTTAPAASAGGNVEQGRQAYRKCQVCHSLESGKNGVGPALAGIIGKKAARTFAGYDGMSNDVPSAGLGWQIGLKRGVGCAFRSTIVGRFAF